MTAGTAQLLEGIAITHPDKLLYPELGVTKGELAEYYRRVADAMLPEVSGRPLALVRCPAGQKAQCFFQKHPGESAPRGLERISIAEKQKRASYIVVRDREDLILLAQMNVLEIHCWGSRAERLERPDRIVFDLDPDAAVAGAEVVRAARLIRELLEQFDLAPFVRTTGGKGLHVVVPIAPAHSWNEVKRFTKTVAESLAHESPEMFVSTSNKAKRKGRIFVDYLRNTRGATSIANYSPRARAGAPVAVPLRWNELRASMRYDAYDIRSVLRRLKRVRDPWRGIDAKVAKLPRLSH